MAIEWWSPALTARAGVNSWLNLPTASSCCTPSSRARWLVLPGARQISQVAGARAEAVMACESVGASALSRMAKHAIQTVQRLLVKYLRMVTIICELPCRRISIRPGTTADSCLTRAPGLEAVALDQHRVDAVGQPDLAVLDGALQLHVAVRHFLQLGAGLGRDVDDGKVFRTLELVGDLLVPDVAGRAVAVDHHVFRPPAGFHQALFIGLAHFDPQFNGARQILLPQVRLVRVEQALGEFQALAGVDGKGQQADHDPLVRL